MRLEGTFAMYGGFWSDNALDSLDGTTQRIGNKTYFFNKKEGHLMVNFDEPKPHMKGVLGKHLDFGVDIVMDEDQTSVLSVGKFNTVRIVNVCAEEGAIPLREVL